VNWKEFAPRKEKALKIQYILTDFCGEKLGEWYCLDIGCGDGTITNALGNLFAHTVGIDYSLQPGYAERWKMSKAKFSRADGRRLPFADNFFDLVVCAQVYEHIIRADRLPEEIARVLKPGGLCFFSGPNKSWPVEPHYKLPFLHWLPDWLATAYLRLSGRGKRFDIHPYTYRRLRHIWRRFIIHDYTIPMLRDPVRFGLSGFLARVSSCIPTFVFQTLYFLLPNYNWILVKAE
jgi:ubiquinone/menaquinone biosynthesis C-methylase UbiE